VLERIVAERGAPTHIRCDNGPEFIAKALQRWCLRRGSRTSHIEPGAPWQNPFVESYNGHLRKELLDLELLDSVLEAQVLIDDWREEYNTYRPHQSLRYLTPVELALLHWPWGRRIDETRAMRSRPRPHSRSTPCSPFAGYRFPPEVITLAVRWYLRFGLSYRDVEELLGERGIEVDHVTVYRWVQRFALKFAEAARARQHVVGDRWHVDETYLKIGGTWRYLFRAIDQFGQVIDVYLSPRRDANAARRFFAQAIGRTRISPVEVTTDRYRLCPRVLDEMLPAAFHETEVHANNPIETDHGRLKARLRPMRGLKRDGTARVIVAGHAFIQNLRRGHYDLGTDVPLATRLADAFAELALVI
jgi:transposase-like protein